MDVHPQILIFAGSLAAIFALAGLAAFLRLGGTPTLSDESEAIIAAGEVADGYEATEAALDVNGAGALLKDGAGRIMLIKPHGNQFAGRILSSGASAAIDQGQITVSTGEARFGSVKMTLVNAASWAEEINRLRSADDA